MSILAILGGFISSYGGPIAVTAIVAQSIGRAIPDSKKGFLGIVRKVAKTVGLYANPEQVKLNQQVVQLESEAHAAVSQPLFGGPQANQ